MCSFISGGEDGVVALCGPLLLNIVCCSCSPGSCLIVSWVPQRSQLHWNFRVFKKKKKFLLWCYIEFWFVLIYRGCKCRHGRQRRAARGGGQPGQRVDPQTRLQEHTRYSLLDESYNSVGLAAHAWGSLFLFSSAATYVKVYLLENGVCLAKKKTKVVKKTLDPTYQQALLFDESPQGKVLQVSNPLFLAFTIFRQTF